jgi:putative ABC transport system permease protein
MNETQMFQLYDKLKNADGVYQSTYQADLTYPCTTSDFPSDFVSTYRKSVGDKSTGNILKLPLDVQFIEDGIYYDFIESLGLPKLNIPDKTQKFSSWQ